MTSTCSLCQSPGAHSVNTEEQPSVAPATDLNFGLIFLLELHICPQRSKEPVNHRNEQFFFIILFVILVFLV